jgi:hypothetical protein
MGISENNFDNNMNTRRKTHDIIFASHSVPENDRGMTAILNLMLLLLSRISFKIRIPYGMKMS